jgi:hypothetical protein
MVVSVCNAKGSDASAASPTRVFLEKRLQTIENKGRECSKERKEKQKRPQGLEKSRLDAGGLQRLFALLLVVGG